MQQIIENNGVVLALVLRNGDWPTGLNFLTKDQDFVQVSTWNYEQGKKTKPHGHNRVKREADLTQEVLYLKSGRLKATIYNLEDKIAEELVLSAGDLIVIWQGGHAYEILENNTQVLEFKNGPYLGLERDKKVIN